MRDTEREKHRRRQREKQGPCREPGVGLNPGSRITPWTEGGAKPLSHPGSPKDKPHIKISTTPFPGGLLPLTVGRTWWLSTKYTEWKAGNGNFTRAIPSKCYINQAIKLIPPVLSCGLHVSLMRFYFTFRTIILETHNASLM